MRRVLLAFEPPDGGVAENVAQLALGLPEHGWEPTVVGPLESTIYTRLQAADVELHKLPFNRGFGDPANEVRALRGLRRLLEGGRFDLVHAHSSKAGALARLAARNRVAAVYSPHCFAFVGEVGGPQRALAIAVERLLGRRTAAILCVCEDEKRRALDARIAPSSRLHHIYNGVEPCPEGAEVDERLAEWPGEGPIVGAIAVLRRQKRLDLLIDAAPKILSEEPGARVAIVGNGPEEANLLAHAAALGLDREPRFRMMPFRESSWRYLAGLDLFVLPSQWEAFPIGILEALACGVPQVATDVGGTGEAVSDGETGLLVRPAADEIARATVELLRDPDRRAAMARASRNRRDERFTIERMVAEITGVYDTVTSAGG